MPSNYFFLNQTKVNFKINLIHFAFIDGLHLFEFVFRDFINIETRSSNKTIVAIDNIFPNHIEQTTRKRKTKIWTDDVWKIILCLKQYRSDLKLTMIDFSD